MSAAVSADGVHVVTASDDKTARCGGGDGELVRELKGHTGGVDVGGGERGRRARGDGVDDGRLAWRLADGELVRELKGHTDWVIRRVSATARTW